MLEQHKTPIHLDQPDKFILGLTSRQTIIMALGLSFGYLAFSAFDYIDNLLLLIPALLCFALCVLAAALLAFIRYKHRDLEQWALIVFMFYASPRRYLWRAVMISALSKTETSEHLELDTNKEEGQEKW